VSPPRPTPDTIAGSDVANELYGVGGDDTLTGLGGDDYLHGGAGTDTADGGDGTDTCLAETAVNCESAKRAALTSAGLDAALARIAWTPTRLDRLARVLPHLREVLP
jgi:hypothetical protein